MLLIILLNPFKKKISHSGIDLSCGAKHDHGKLVLELSDFELKLLNDNSISYNVLIDDLTKFYKARIDNTYDEAIRNLDLEKSITRGKLTRKKNKACNCC